MSDSSFFNRVPGLVAFLLSSILLGACVKGDDESVPDRAFVSFFNSADGLTDGASFYINKNAIRSGTLPADSSSAYNQIYSGTHVFQCSPAGRDLSAQVAEASQELMPGKYYSCFLVGDKSPYQFIFSENSYAGRDSAGKARIRFVNLSHAAGIVEVNTARGKTLFKEQEFGKTSQWSFVDTAKSLIRVYTASEPKLKLDSLSFHPKDRNIYTLYLRPAGEKHKLVARRLVP